MQQQGGSGGREGPSLAELSGSRLRGEIDPGLIDSVGDGVADCMGLDTIGDGRADFLVPLDAPYAEQRGALLALLASPLAEAVSLFATLLLLGTFALEGQASLTTAQAGALLLAERGASLLLLLEFCARWLGAGLRPAYLLTPLMLFDLINVVAVLPVLLPVDQLPPGLPALGDPVGGLRLLRAARILRFSRLLSRERFGPIASALGMSSSEADEEAARRVARVGFSAISIICVAAGLTWEAERGVNPGINSYWDALYLSVTTLTTVGYGDVVPITSLGRGAVVLQMVAAVTWLPFELAKLATAVSTPSVELAEREVACVSCALGRHQADAVFCRRCGTRLPQPPNLLRVNKTMPASMNP